MQDGQIVSDGSVKWQICDTRIPFPVGYVIHDRILRTGFIKSNNATILINDFIRLYNWANDNGLIIAETLKNSDIKYSSFFGTGNGSTTFSLPDERGLTDKSWDDGRGLDVNRELGTYQEDAIRNIAGGLANLRMYPEGTTSYGAFSSHYNGSHPMEFSSSYGAHSSTFSADRVVPTALENRVRNVAKIAQIKY